MARRTGLPARMMALMALVLLAGCVRMIPGGTGTGTVTPPSRPSQPSQPSLPPPPANAVALGVRAGPPIATLQVGAADGAAALASFRESCPSVSKRTDGSGLTRPTDWQTACAAAKTWPNGSATQFFQTYFETVKIGDGRGFATGYYEPEIAGSRQHLPGYDVPIYGMPADLVRAQPGDAVANAKGQMPLGRYDQSGQFVPYYDRGAIEDGALANKGLEIAWARDAVEVFFLQVQGSGRLRAPDGTVMRIGYAGQNGWPYTGIGAVMRDQGLVGTGPGQYPGSMQGIMQYIHDHPVEGDALMRQNQSWVFFRELTGDGPLGALGVPVRAHASVAADPKFVPLGAPVWLSLDRSEASGVWIAQDTGGAIKGANRFDTFWGAGDQARVTAGGMSGRGEALVLVPKGTLAKLKQP
ncbi:murein transglycosylase A [Novosphingobium sp. BL-8A]|uniref:murein transglycosylase A n=1 Tax=Novosphingobium sp. BL-8A TaxID=3127639 RepID=UPI0037566F81